MAVMGAALLAAWLGTCPRLPAQSRPVSQPASRDEQLWSEIEALSAGLSTVTPFPAFFARAEQTRRALVEKTRSYLAAYPGGPRRDAAVQLQLKALFEIAVLTGDGFDELRVRVAEYLDHPPSTTARGEAAYWAIQLGRLEEGSAAARLATDVTCPDEQLLSACRSFVADHRASRHTPGIAAELFDDAVGRGALLEAARFVALLTADFTEDLVRKQLRARLRRRSALGKPLALAQTAADGTPVDTGSWKGEPVLVVFWAAFDEPSRACLDQIEAVRRQSPDLHVVCVNLDADAARMEEACRAAGLSWPQLHDGLGWAGPLAVEWGVRELPTVLVVDQEGRLAGVAEATDWPDLVELVLQN
jgi:hypothetical protein